MHNITAFHWAGRAWLLPGYGVFLGRVGNNEDHIHQAHQLSIGLDNAISVSGEQTRLSGRALFIPAGIRHRLSGSTVLSLYLDPLTAEARAVATAAMITGQGDEMRLFEAANADELCALIERGAVDLEQLRGAIRRLLGLADLPAPEQRLGIVIGALQRAENGVVPDRRALAGAIGLSPTRFSHWFVEQTGLPLRSYGKWLRLLAALQAIASGRNLTAAAHAAGFADSAHLSRTFRDLFGIDPSSALQHVELRH